MIYYRSGATGRRKDFKSKHFFPVPGEAGKGLFGAAEPHAGTQRPPHPSPWHRAWQTHCTSSVGLGAVRGPSKTLRGMKGLGVPRGRVGPTGVARAGPQFAPGIDCPWEHKW